MKDLPSAHGVLSDEQRHELQAIIGPSPTVPWAAAARDPLDGPHPPLGMADYEAAQERLGAYRAGWAPAMVSWARAGGAVTAAQILQLCRWQDRNRGPALLRALYEAGVLDTDTLRGVVVDIWNSAEFPTRYEPPWLWRQWFAEVGYTVDGMPAQRPEAPLLLFRGCGPEAVRGMSWTADSALAQWFASARRGDEGFVIAARVEPRRLLAEITPTSPLFRTGEGEHIIDARWLRCRLASVDELPIEYLAEGLNAPGDNGPTVAEGAPGRTERGEGGEGGQRFPTAGPSACPS
jgi:hypothetical protein